MNDLSTAIIRFRTTFESFWGIGCLRGKNRIRDSSDIRFQFVELFGLNVGLGIFPRAVKIARDLKSAASACHCRLEQTIEVAAAFTNADKVVAQVVSNRPDAVLVWFAPIPCAKLAKILRATGYNGALAGPGWLRSADFISTAGNACEGFLIPGIVQTKTSEERWHSFQAAYQQRWRHEPDWMAGMSYDAALLLFQIVRQGDFQGPSHRLRTGFSWPGVTGDLTFDSDGNRQLKLGHRRHSADLLMGSAAIAILLVVRFYFLPGKPK